MLDDAAVDVVAVLLDAVGPFLAAVGDVVEAIAADVADAGKLDWRGQGQH